MDPKKTFKSTLNQRLSTIGSPIDDLRGHVKVKQRHYGHATKVKQLLQGHTTFQYELGQPEYTFQLQELNWDLYSFTHTIHDNNPLSIVSSPHVIHPKLKIAKLNDYQDIPLYKQS